MFKIIHEDVFTFSTSLAINKQAISINGEASLYLWVYIGVSSKREVYKHPLKLRWPVDRIDLKSHVLLPRHKDDPDVNDYNMIIMSDRARHNEIAKIYRLSGKKLTIQAFKRELKLNDKRQYVASYMIYLSKERYVRREISFQTWKNVQTSIRALQDYKEGVTFDEIDERWLDGYKAWLARTQKLAPNTVWNRIKDLKRYLRLAQKEVGVYVNPEAARYRNNPTVQAPVYLNRDELKRMMLILDARALTPTQYNVLRAFLFTCFTSLRISDVYRVGKDWMVTDSYIQFVARKNREVAPKQIRIPLVPMAKALIDESRLQFFELPTEQEYNRTLKELAVKAEIRKKVTSHVGRHTFGYLYMTTVGNLYALKEIMGHSSIVTTERYAHLDDDYDFEQMLKIQSGFQVTAQSGLKRELVGVFL